MFGILARRDRTSPLAFWFGALAVTTGVALHLPMFFSMSSMGYRMAGMPMDTGMIVGMVLIVVGFAASAYGLFPPAQRQRTAITPQSAALSVETDGRLSPAHWKLMLVLTLALIIDTMKPASLGFVVPGTASEYGLSRPAVALLPFVALIGTTVGSLLWGFLADHLGRRASILLAGIMFIGTAICGAMPSFTWNLIMCFLMGVSAGGLLPIAFTLLAELVPTAHRGWCLVLLGGLGMSAGYLAASVSATLLEPTFGWRIMWLLGLPTGVGLILLNAFIPESPKFLLLHGRIEEAQSILRRFQAAMPHPPSVEPIRATANASLLFRRPFAKISASLNLAALAWGLVNFGFVLWLPAELRARGLDAAASDAILAQSALIVLPTAMLGAWLYATWSTKNTVVIFTLLTVAGLVILSALAQNGAIGRSALMMGIVILMVGANGMNAVLIPYGVENYPLQIRGRGTGLIAGMGKAGGIVAQSVTLMALVPGLTAAGLVIAAPVALSAGMIARYGAETRLRRLEEVDLMMPANSSAL